MVRPRSCRRRSPTPLELARESSFRLLAGERGGNLVGVGEGLGSCRQVASLRDAGNWGSEDPGWHPLCGFTPRYYLVAPPGRLSWAISVLLVYSGNWFFQGLEMPVAYFAKATKARDASRTVIRIMPIAAKVKIRVLNIAAMMLRPCPASFFLPLRSCPDSKQGPRRARLARPRCRRWS